MSNVPSSAISEGKKEWAIQVVDNVGNQPITEDVDKDGKVTRKAALGAVGKTATLSGNPFIFYVDTKGPTITSATETGLYLKNPGVTTGEVAGQEAQKTNNRNWVRVNFDLGDGTAPLDASSVSANDFRVDGTEPTAILINANDQDGAGKGSAVYLNVSELDTDARPKVELVGEIMDRAGNIRTEGKVDNALDGLAPIITATTSVDISAVEVMVTVTSSERLGLNPTVQLTKTKPVKDADIEGPSDLTIGVADRHLHRLDGHGEQPCGRCRQVLCGGERERFKREPGCDRGRGLLQRRSVYRQGRRY